MLCAKFNLFTSNCFLIISKSITFYAHLSQWSSENKNPKGAQAKSQSMHQSLSSFIAKCSIICCLLNKTHAIVDKWHHWRDKQRRKESNPDLVIENPPFFCSKSLPVSHYTRFTNLRLNVS